MQRSQIRELWVIQVTVTQRVLQVSSTPKALTPIVQQQGILRLVSTKIGPVLKLLG